ncbi:MAG: histidine phosphatase family protein [Candidatus Phytoplasma sp.]|nr:histidine phosphatase family protein [Phytoplasma sp.]
MIIALIRHGETNYNLNKKVQGSTDNPLNQNGVNQIKNLTLHLKNSDPIWDIIGSSHLIRAQESAQIIADGLSIKDFFIEPLLTERDFGPYEGKDVSIMRPLIALDNYREDGFEDNEKLLTRVSKALINLSFKYKDKKVLFVCHSHVIKSALIHFDPKTYTYMNHEINNSSVYYFKINEDTFTYLKKIDLV